MASAETARSCSGRMGCLTQWSTRCAARSSGSSASVVLMRRNGTVMSKPKPAPDPFLIDDENPEWTEADFAEAKPAPAELIAAMAEAAAEQRRRGRPPIGDVPKETINLRLSADVIAGLRALPGYNVRVDALLRAALAEGKL